MGRRPLPTKIKSLRGTIRPHRINPNEPEPEPGIPDCPVHLGAIARCEWDRISKELIEMGLLSELDMAALAGYCVNYQRWVEAEEILRLEGILVTNYRGHISKHPAVKIASDAMQLMLRFLTEFGLTPASRTKATSIKKMQKSPTINWDG